MSYNVLISIKQDIEKREKPPQEFFANCVNNRLKKGLEAYEDYLDKSVRYLSRMKGETLVKRI